jgi:hypothetical protein
VKTCYDFGILAMFAGFETRKHQIEEVLDPPENHVGSENRNDC